MRKILLALFVFGLVLTLGAPASAVDLKVSGSYYATGMFITDPSLRSEDDRFAGGAYHSVPADRKVASSASFVGQRLRLQPEFKIAEGLTLTTRFDALEKKWGDSSWGGVHGYDNTNRPVDQQRATNWDTYAINGSSIRTQENLEWERAYVDFNTAIGRFMVGYFDCICYGTLFLNTHVSRPGVKYMYPMGPWTFMAQWEKVHEGGSYGIGSSGASLLYADKDLDIYSVGVDYRWKTGVAGVQFQYYKDNYNDYSAGDATGAYRSNLYTINPFFQAAIGNLGLEGEFWYGFGDWRDYNGGQDDISLDAYAAYLNGKFNIGAFYIGALGAIESGDADATDDKQKGSVLGAGTGPFVMGQAWDPFLYMFNDLVNTYTGNWYGYNASPTGTFEDNCMLWKIYGGWNVTPKLNVEVAYGMAWADDTVSGVDDSYGSEFDIFATYKIYNNLSYMVGFGYWWVGDYFKGTVDGDTEDSYLLMHKLTLAF